MGGTGVGGKEAFNIQYSTEQYSIFKGRGIFHGVENPDWSGQRGRGGAEMGA